MEPQQDTPIDYPKLLVPGHGTFIVKFGLGAQYTLDTELGMDPQTFIAKLQEWFPKPQKDAAGEPVMDQEGNPVMIPGKVGPSFLFKVLAACLEGQGLRLPPRELADCFQFHQLPSIARVVMEAFSKTQWSAQSTLQEPATAQEQRPN